MGSVNFNRHHYCPHTLHLQVECLQDICTKQYTPEQRKNQFKYKIQLYDTIRVENEAGRTIEEEEGWLSVGKNMKKGRLVKIPEEGEAGCQR